MAGGIECLEYWSKFRIEDVVAGQAEDWEKNMHQPQVSIVMPVFNTGRYLQAAIDSILCQQPQEDCNVPAYELLIVDDHSADPETLAILDAASRQDARIKVVKNARRKGAAGARNTGILQATGKWIGFLDSDDVWLPHSLAVRWHFILQNPDAKWVAAYFFLDKPGVGVEKVHLSKRSPKYYDGIRNDYDAGRATCFVRPMEMFAKSCFIGIMTVLIQRDLLVQKDMFDERLRRAEDYHLWFRCARDNDLWMLPFDVANYRIHSGSLTHGKAPRHLHEDQMIKLLLQDPAFRGYKKLLEERLDFVFSDYCYFYRGERQHSVALRWAFEWIKSRPLNLLAWKEVAASVCRA
jgi:glycosyltransferase involved in cell wall biosynthesis